MNTVIRDKDPIISGGHFTWGEYLTLRMWRRMAIPKGSHVANIQFLFEKLEKLIRLPLNKPLIISSGYRTSQYAAYLRSIRIPAAMQSAHNSGEAVDLEPPYGMSVKELWQFCDSRWPGRIELLKYTPGWVHLDTRQWGERIRFRP